MKPAENASSDENSEGRGSLAVKAPISNQSFAEQLSAKLGNVISQKEHIGDIVGDINKRPIQTATNTNYIGGLYPDEPPPLDYTEDQRSSKEQPSLFDENDDDDLFWGQRPKQTSNQKRVFVDNDQPNRIDRSSENAARTSQIARGLFDSDSSTDESDLFAGSAKALSKPPFLQTHKTSAPLFDDLPPDLEDKEKEPEAVVDNKKPVGGVSIFGNTNIFANQSISDVLETKRSQRMKGNESNEEPNKNKIETESRSKQLLNHKKQSKTPSLFDDDDDEVDFTAPKKTVGLFESGTEKTGVTSKKLDFFDESVDENSSGVASRKVSLFDDSVSDEDTNAVKKPTVNSEGITQKKTSFFEEQEPVKPKGSLPADSSPEKEDASKKLTAKTSKKISLFDDDDDFFKDDIFSNLGIQKGSKKGLFDDLGDTDSDLFSLSKNMDKKTDSKSKKTSLFSDNEDEEDIFESKTIKPDLVKESKKISSLFSDTEEEAQSDGVKSEPPPSKVEEERAEKKQVVESLSERKVIGAEVCDDESKNKKNEKKSGGDDVRIPKKDESEIPQIDETLSHTQSNDQILSETKPTEIKDGSLFETQSSNAILSSTKEEPKEQKPVISLFSSAPPSDDEDDWDTKSDNVSDNDDYRPYSIDDNGSRSSLFDNEPPSLNPNESSGIVRDQNVTRVDSDDSSFYPHASSSKRFSSDIFAEQQSQDKLFVTGSTTESSVFPSSAESSSITELTNKIISDIMGDTSFLITDNTLESTSTTHGLTEETSTATDVEKSDDSIKSRTTKIEGTVEQEKRSSTSMKSEKGDGDAKKEDSSGSPAKRGSPLKLKPNLNINVNALLPGSTPPKLKTPRVGESGDKDKVDSLSERKPVKIVDSQTENKRKDPISCSIPPPLPISVEEHVEKPISFDDSLDRVKVLHSVTKDRARIPVRRKPSTRQARQEAARKSAIFLEDADLDEKSTQKDASPLKTDVYKGKSEVKKDSKENTSLFDDEVKAKTESKKTASTSLFDDSDENDIFRDSIQNTDSIPKDSIKSPSKSKSEDDVISSTDDKVDSTIDEKIDVSSQSAEKTPVKSSKPEKTDKSPFDESTESEDDFFKRTVKKPTKTKSSLFDSGDESDNDLFGSKSSKDETKTEIKKVAKKKSLFDDSESDDDLFSSAKSKDAPSGTGTKSSKRATKKRSSLKKLDKDEASEDPLSNI
ncbi:unnamed protein product [Acanthoscelides obtectus]|nr:unnamed protein product [Acanthoscelides obtectus]CAK1639099.1 hypothetical protein AOBTE_LOCUS10995 [Acanthoscelides obtectus]